MSKAIRALIFRMVAENPTWGAPCVHGELLKLGFDFSERNVSRWVRRAPRDSDPAKRWLTFLRNHREAIAAMDFFTVPTLTFGVLRAIQAGNNGQGIFRRTRSAGIRLRVARETLVGVEAGTEAVIRAFGHDLNFSEPGLPILEERSFVRRKTLQRSASTRRAAAHARVYWV